LLRVLLPDLAPYSEETAEQFAAQRGWGRKMNILIRPDERIRPLDELLALYLTEQSRLSYPIPGLAHGADDAGGHVYYARQHGKVDTLIRCLRQSVSCQHMFPYGALNVRPTYARDYLFEWRSLEMSTSGLLDRFRRPSQSRRTGS